MGKGFNHEDKLASRRWKMSYFLDSNGSSAQVLVFGLVFSPTHFEIEYLRIDLHPPFNRKITVVDGRKDEKEWIHEYGEENINPRIYSQYASDRNFKF